MNPNTTSINQFLSSIDEDYKNYKEEIAKKIKESEVQSMNVMDPMKRIPTQPNQFVSSMMRDLELFKGSNFYETSQKKIETQRNHKIRIQEKQNELSDIEKRYKNETKQIEKKMGTIDSMIKFLQSLNYESLDNEEIKEIITKMKAVGENIIKNEKITKLKQEYIQKRKELLPHLTLMKTLNQLNVANMCPICFKGKVTHYLHPCGHTGCKECLEKNRRERQTMTDLPQSDISFECPFCRNHIQSLKPLYFL